MVKIIKKGTRQVAECEVCGCYFSFDITDIELGLAQKGPHPEPEKNFVRCPQCKTEVYLKTGEKWYENSLIR